MERDVTAHIVLIETSGNQAFIFATNKLRENVGASELTAQVGTQFVREAMQEAGAQLPRDFRDPATFPTLSDTNPVEVILAVSGKALLLVHNATTGRQIVRAVTLRALRDAPGLEARGVVSRDFDFETTPLHPLIGEVHRQFEVVRSRFPGPAARFQRLTGGRLTTSAQCLESEAHPGGRLAFQGGDRAGIQGRSNCRSSG